VPGASTLATQLEKFRHSPDGRTGSTREKLLQMEAASLRSYLGGENTEAARRRIVTDYLNSVPLAAIAGYGEVTGLCDGLWAWYGADADEVNRLLWDEGSDGTARGVAYREVLSLMLAHRRPSYLLLQPAGREELRHLTDQHLRLIAREGIISAALRDAALAVDLTPRGRAPAVPRASFIDRKAANAVRMELLGLTGARSLYALDRFDLTARTTLDLHVQSEVTDLLRRLTDRGFVRAQGLVAPGLLRRGDPARVIYAVALYERTATGNVVRVQVDNGDAPFNVVEGSKLELGSTAKLRALISYLEIVEQLYLRNNGRPAANLRAEPVGPGDDITAWTFAYLASNPGVSLERLLEAAMLRPYSASPAETFAGTATYAFRNSDTSDDQRAPSVREAFVRSVNLPFIRIMRDIVHYYLYRLPGSLQARADHSAQALWDPDDGRALLEHAYAQQADSTIWRGRSQTQLAWVYRSVAPEAGLEEFRVFVRRWVVDARLSDASIIALYDGADPTGFSIADRAHLADVPPLDLWLATYLREHAGASEQDVFDASATIRQEIAGARLAPPAAERGQWVNRVPEQEAFGEIQRSWGRLGYPFGALAPSYATAIGSSADRPDHLAELVGIVLNDGVRYPVRRVEELHYAAGTPYETLLRLSPRKGERVLSSEIAAVVRSAMVDVVGEGTAQRAFGLLRGSDGSPLAIGAKTGTGNNRYRVVTRDGRVIEDRAVDRTAAVVFFIGDRLYGSITVFVAGKNADRYDFTSALPVQILRMLGPTFAKLEP
jgi:membrane peptidoglycan carboxypeptidase